MDATPKTLTEAIRYYSDVQTCIKQVGKLEVCLEHVEKRLEKLEGKIDTVQGDIAHLKTTLDTLKPLAISVGKGIWAGIILVGTFILTITGFWLKHKMGW